MSSNANSTSPEIVSPYSKIRATALSSFFWLLAILQYGALSYVALLEPMITAIVHGRFFENSWDWSGAPAIGLVCLMLNLGVLRMRAILKRIPNQIAVKQGVACAAALSLPSIYAHFVLINRVLELSIFSNLSRGYLGSTLSIMIAYLLFGFYMPFIMITFWLRYHYREDEF